MERVRSMLIDFSEGEGRKRLGDSEDDQLYIYHLEIMQQAGLITYRAAGSKDGTFLFEPPKLTWQGNDYMESISNDTIWKKTKDAIKSRGMKLSEVSLEIVVAVAKAQAKKSFGLE